MEQFFSNFMDNLGVIATVIGAIATVVALSSWRRRKRHAEWSDLAKRVLFVADQNSRDLISARIKNSMKLTEWRHQKKRFPKNYESFATNARELESIVRNGFDQTAISSDKLNDLYNEAKIMWDDKYLSPLHEFHLKSQKFGFDCGAVLSQIQGGEFETILDSVPLKILDTSLSPYQVVFSNNDGDDAFRLRVETSFEELQNRLRKLVR